MQRVRTDQYMRGEHLLVKGPFVLDTRTYDIPNTIAGMVRALPKNCVGLSLGLAGGGVMIRRAEREARKRGIRIFWLGR